MTLDEAKTLRAGDKIRLLEPRQLDSELHEEVFVLRDELVFANDRYYIFCEFPNGGFSWSWYQTYENAELIPLLKEGKMCICPIHLLMQRGCNCGGA